MLIRTLDDARKVLCVVDGEERPNLVSVFDKYAESFGLFGIQLLISAKYNPTNFEFLALMCDKDPRMMRKVFLSTLPGHIRLLFVRCIAQFERAQTAKGQNPDDFLYAQAEQVQRAVYNGYVHVAFKGVLYRMLRESTGALDCDPAKSTVLVQTEDGVWYKLWYFDADVQDLT